MKGLKKVLILIAILLTVTTVSAFAAANYDTPAETAAGLTGKSLENVIAEKSETGMTYGDIANEAGKRDEFKAEMLEIKREVLSKKVAEGIITQEKADEIITALEENQVACDGEGSKRVGNKLNAGFGKMMGNGQGQGGFRRGQNN